MSELIPAGRVRAVAVQQDTDNGAAWAQFSSTKTGSTQVVVQFEIIEHPDCAGRRVVWFGTFAGGATDITLKGLRSCGFQGDDLTTLPSQQINNIVELTIEHSVWEGKTSAKVAFVNSPYTGIKIEKPLVGADLARFAATLKAKLKGIPVVAGEKIGGKKQTSFASETGTASIAPSDDMEDLDI